MPPSKQVYKNPQAGQPLITTISSGFKTPILQVKFCNLVNPYYYDNSPTVPRHSVTCVFDPKEYPEFINSIQTIEKNEKVDTIIRNETAKDGDNHITTGNVLIKFQTKDKIPVYMAPKPNENDKEAVLLELEDELAKGERIMVVYDILRYTKKNTMKTEHGISFKPIYIWYYPKE